MTDASLLIDALRRPERLDRLDAAHWNDLIRIARAESLIGQLGTAVRGAGISIPLRASAILDDAALDVARSQRNARWEVRETVRALQGLDVPVVLLKGAAYVMAGLPPAEGRTVGDLDILVPKGCIEVVEAHLLAAGWAALKTDAYDDSYYRRWMHELPPLAHIERGAVIDVHHTILPLTSRLRPNADALLTEAVAIEGGLSILSPADMVLHSATHLFYDGDFEGGLRNLWDIHRLLTRFGADPTFWPCLAEHAARHQLHVPLARALRHAHALFGTEIDATLAGRSDWLDRLIRKRLLARDRYGQRNAPITDALLYLRSHWLRMPPALLARHLFTKARMRWRTASRESAPIRRNDR